MSNRGMLIISVQWDIRRRTFLISDLRHKMLGLEHCTIMVTV